MLTIINIFLFLFLERSQERQKQHIINRIHSTNKSYFLTQDKRIFLWVKFECLHLSFFSLLDSLGFTNLDMMTFELFSSDFYIRAL
jgi:hypothetical protein